MNRRGFFGGLLALLATPWKALAAGLAADRTYEQCVKVNLPEPPSVESISVTCEIDLDDTFLWTLTYSGGLYTAIRYLRLPRFPDRASIAAAIGKPFPPWWTFTTVEVRGYRGGPFTFKQTEH